MKKDKDYEFFLRKDFSSHSGKWVGISGAKIISSSRSIKKTMTEARRKSMGKEILFAKIPKKNEILIL